MTVDEPLVRGVETMVASQPTLEGAGVHLRRAFGRQDVPRLDPFLLLDDFRSQNPIEFEAGFPWHPHRGIETVTYMIDGWVEHEDSLGNKGIIAGGDVQWMNAGSGIIHQEMPKARDGRMGGLQLWVNLPSKHKMARPGYQEVKKDRIPQVQIAKGVEARVVAGAAAGVRGPVQDLAVAPQFLDVRIRPGHRLDHPIPRGHRALAYVLEGAGRFEPETVDRAEPNSLVVFGDGDTVVVEADKDPLRMLLVSGRPLGEPIAWWGPIVMNNRRELETAVQEFHEGTFIKQHPPSLGNAS